MPTLTSDRYHIKWTQLANLPAPIYYPYVTVQDKKVYVAGGDSPDDDTEHQVYIYDVNTDHWGQLPPSGHYYGIPHIIGGKLVVIGRRLSATKKLTNKVSTFDDKLGHLIILTSQLGANQEWLHTWKMSLLPGGDTTVQDDIEVLNWVENSHWRKVSINLPVPMYGFTPIIANNHYVIVGYADRERSKSAYKIS